MRMIYFKKPSIDTLSEFRETQRSLAFTYSAVGASAMQPPPGFIVDRTRIQLGVGENAFQTAKAALQRWEQFNLGWFDAWPTNTPIHPGEIITVKGHMFGLWWLNACRIVYIVDESGPITRYGFAYGTLPGHFECGEERFLVEWNRSDDSVWFDIIAFSRPNLLLAKLGYPFVRRAQKRFGRDACSSMLRAVQSAAPKR